MTKMVVPPPADELVGFVPFRPGIRCIEGIVLIIARTYIRLSDRAMAELGNPEYVNIFLDYSGKRMMITPSNSKTENTIKVGMMPKTKKCCVLSAEGLRKEIVSVAGSDVMVMKFIEGHRAKSKTVALIFDLNMEKK